MKLAIMQPYFFPYIGYFSLMDYADEFILFDIVQYDRKGWMHRNRILKPGGGWQYFRAGIKKPPFLARIADVQLQEDDVWKLLIRRQLEHYKTKAPFYEEVVERVMKLLNGSVNTLVDLNKRVLEDFRDLLEIECPIRVCSTLDFDLKDISHAGQWALKLSEMCGADEYVNPIGGKDLFRADEFALADIKLSFLQHQLPTYSQYAATFEPALSIVDLLMFNSVEQARRQLKMYKV